MTRCLRIAAFTAAVVLVTASMAEAQREGGRRGGGGFGFGGRGGIDSTGLLAVEKVQNDLGLDLEQGEKIHQIREEMRDASREMFSGLRDLSREERRERFAEMREKFQELTSKNREKVNAVLSENQSARLDQIALQVRGPMALTDEKTAEKLGVSSDQKEQIAAVQDDARSKQREMFQSIRDGGGDFSQMREKMQEMRKATTEKIIGILTTSQKEEFVVMQGEKLELTPEDLRSARGGFGGRGGRGGAGGGRRGQPGDNQ